MGGHQPGNLAGKTPFPPPEPDNLAEKSRLYPNNPLAILHRKPHIPPPAPLQIFKPPARLLSSEDHPSPPLLWHSHSKNPPRTAFLKFRYNPPMAPLHRMTDGELPAVLSPARPIRLHRRRPRFLEPRPHDGPAAATARPRRHLRRHAHRPRTLHISPNRPLNVGWLSSNQFATRMSLRRQTGITVPQLAASSAPNSTPCSSAAATKPRCRPAGTPRPASTMSCRSAVLYLEMASPPAPRKLPPRRAMSPKWPQ